MRNAPVLTPPRRLTGRADLYCAIAGAVLVATAFLVPRILGERERGRLFAGAAPIFGNWLPHIGWGTAPAIGIAALVIVYGPELAHRLPWRRALLLTWVTAAAWAFALAMVDGWQRGFAGRLTTRDEYLHEVGGVHDIAAMLRGFSSRILDFQPDSWTTHVSGHPPGALLTFVLLDRLGLGGGAWAALLCVLVGSSVAVAVPVTIRVLGAASTGSENTGRPGRSEMKTVIRAGHADLGAPPVESGPADLGRRAGGATPRTSATTPGSSANREAVSAAEWRSRAALPFLALAPAAIWIAVSADGLFAGVTAWAVALLAIATRQQRNWVLAAIGAGLLFGYGIFLSYGLVLMAVPAAAILIARTLRPAVPALLGVLLVVFAFKAAGFWWLDGYHLVVQRYYQGIASDRPYSYWVWANLAATVCAVGLASVAALHRVARGLEFDTLWGKRDLPMMPRSSTPKTPTREPLVPVPATAPAAGTASAPPPSSAGSAVSAPISAAISPPVMGAERSKRSAARPGPFVFAQAAAGCVDRVRRWRAAVDPVALVTAAGVIALLLADLSGLSKAETERIWLPFDVWVLAGAALLPARGVRVWLGVQAVGALVLVHVILTNW
ncbi:hypothetical protein [Nocardia sp. NBC_01503]|uniref:hypothetical protein n=1 Tax=Nocardia sp. NBC_01503 TaxID=2975997 RepID=UPI003FA58856